MGSHAAFRDFIAAAHLFLGFSNQTLIEHQRSGRLKVAQGDGPCCSPNKDMPPRTQGAIRQTRRSHAEAADRSSGCFWRDEPETVPD